jgi:hypothetical protein
MTTRYGTAAGFRAYLSDRGLTNPNAGLDSTVAAKLLVASEWLDATYVALFPGRRTGGSAQEREWPRIGVSDREGYPIASTTVPVQVEYATYEAAHRELDNEGTLSTDYTPSKYTEAAVSGAVSVKFNLFPSAREAQVQIQIVNQILSPILRDNGDRGLSGGACRA